MTCKACEIRGERVVLPVWAAVFAKGWERLLRPLRSLWVIALLAFDLSQAEAALS